MSMYKILFLLLWLPALGSSQSLSGIWAGILTHDSLTIRKDQLFEIALTTYRDKVYGYTYSTFFVNDSLFYIIKRVKGQINGSECVVEDEAIIAHNFQKKPDKGVRVIYTFHQNQQDSSWVLDGKWKTQATKKYYSISGGLMATPEKDITRSQLMDHLSDLKLQHTLVRESHFVQKQENTDSPSQKSDIARLQKNPENTVDKAIAFAEAKPKPKQQTTNRNKHAAPQTVSDNTADNRIAFQKPERNNPLAQNTSGIKTQNQDTGYIYTELKKAERKLKPLTEMAAERNSVPSETLYFHSDSLVLTLYDNGQVDGDTVSVILNGEVIIEKQGLKSTAIKKTIYLAPDESDSVLLVLYAENLGLYPPNTGLLVIKDGDESFSVRFKADYDNNAAILLRRKLH